MMKQTNSKQLLKKKCQAANSKKKGLAYLNFVNKMSEKIDSRWPQDSIPGKRTFILQLRIKKNVFWTNLELYHHFKQKYWCLELFT